MSKLAKGMQMVAAHTMPVDNGLVLAGTAEEKAVQQVRLVWKTGV